MRTANSLKNIMVALMTQFFFILSGFVVRKLFLDNLGIYYLGINGLLSNILSMLGLAEMGIGTAISYSLYKPLADNNRDKITALFQLYKKLYIILSSTIFFISLALFPFLKYFISEGQQVENLPIIYFLFVLRNIISYLYACKISLINADQKNYILGKINLIFQFLIIIIKISVLIVFKNYLIFLGTEVLFFFLQNFLNSKIIGKIYPYLKTDKKHKIDLETKDTVITNTKSLFLHNIGSYFVFGTDNLLISYFINITTVGFYSNYAMLISQVNNLISSLFEGIGASVGNLIATESCEKRYSIFKVIYLINFLAHSTFVIFLYNLVDPFIKWWLGENYLLDNTTLIVLLINFYLTGMRASIGLFKSKGGIFYKDRFMPLIEAVINLVTSLILVKFFGLAGIFMGTTISTFSIVFWTVPYLVFQNLFNQPLKKYFISYFIYIFITLFSGVITTNIINHFFKGDSFLSLFKMGIFAITIPFTINFLFCFRTEEGKYLSRFILKNFIKK